MKKVTLNTTLFILVILFILLSKWDLEYSNSKYKYTAKYNRIVFVALDQYSIIKYHSTDKPIQIFNYNCIKINGHR